MNIQEVALQADSLLKAYQNSEITAEEYKELISTLGAVQALEDATASLEENIHYRNIIVSAINIAVALA